MTEDHGPVRHMVLNRPEKRNALNDELILGFRDAAAAAAADRDVLCVVVRGAGSPRAGGGSAPSTAPLRRAATGIHGPRTCDSRRPRNRSSSLPALHAASVAAPG